MDKYLDAEKRLAELQGWKDLRMFFNSPRRWRKKPVSSNKDHRAVPIEDTPRFQVLEDEYYNRHHSS